MTPAIAVAHPNLALIKYWGRRDPDLNLPANSSISLTLGGALTKTRVLFTKSLTADQFILNGKSTKGDISQRVSSFLDHIRALAGVSDYALVESENDFPESAGIASSASGFAALALAGSRAAGLDLKTSELAVLARKGSGSACRSIHGGIVEWNAGVDDSTSTCHQLVSSDFWDLRIITVIVGEETKEYSSLTGHEAAWFSPLYQARLAALDDSLDQLRASIAVRDFNQFADITERDTVSMHAIAMTSRIDDSPWLSGLYYWSADTMMLIQAVQRWRLQGIAVCFSIDAGPNIHLICPADQLEAVHHALNQLPVRFRLIDHKIGGRARVLTG